MKHDSIRKRHLRDQSGDSDRGLEIVRSLEHTALILDDLLQFSTQRASVRARNREESTS